MHPYPDGSRLGTGASHKPWKVNVPMTRKDVEAVRALVAKYPPNIVAHLVKSIAAGHTIIPSRRGGRA